ncbi:TPA-induced transmembrane protein homolog isoform X1 [Anarrhichthys ocellatus]|uniref:TPA-induced transmembrane protein homolog isoform X1 n=1 Tax=Anarrhichthys ocellatus TaxID=433405 RepID=UPI0012EE925D|nr:TPA-induced transmembrane protein isoform X1 [Anarrhichthys ocellatus]
MDIELQAIRENGNDGATYSPNERMAAGNGDGGASRIPAATERDGLLFGQMNSLWRISRERVRLLLIIICIVVVICAVIGISLAVCAAIHVDGDENFDSSLFTVPRSFNGSFQLPNRVFTEELSTLSSNESQALAADLQEKLADLYRSSPALGRYFSKAEIQAFRNGSVVIAGYQLTFVMPEEQQDQLRNFTLSREMVYNVFRQFLYDQEADESGQMYIAPVSLNMFLRL